jgi:hypothetical protein
MRIKLETGIRRLGFSYGYYDQPEMKKSDKCPNTVS